MSRTKSQKLAREAFREVKRNPPARVERTKRKFGKERARKQEAAIALNKARKKGARFRRKGKKTS